MKIYFTCTTAEFVKYQKLYFSIRDYIVEKGHTITRDWIGETNERIKKDYRKIGNIRKIYLESVNAIKEADLVIVEDTVSNFSTGHQITIALQMKKPVLVLWYEKKHRQFNKMFIHGIESNLLYISEYNLENYKKIVDDFILKYTNLEGRNRFNLVLRDNQREYLDWILKNREISRTKVIQKLVNDEISNDKEYQKYLRKRI